ncbi:MAG: hypothetical protein ACI4WS_14925 [Oscillospiraceae bacterium]
MENIIMLNHPAPKPETVPPDVIPGLTGRTKPREHDPLPDVPQTASDPPRAARRTYQRRRFGVPVGHSLLAAAGTAAGVFFATAAPAGTDFSGSLLCSSGEFLWLMISRALWGLAFLLCEYITGYFALGRALVWIAPFVCGLGTGAALTGAFAVYGAGAVRLIPTCIAVAAAVVCGARASGDMSGQLLRLMCSGRNGMAAVLSDSPAAGEYTLRFLARSAVVIAAAIAEAAVRTFS